MPTVNLSPVFNGWQGFGTDGLPLSGGLLYTYQAGTSTPQATYTTNAGSIANTNPIVLGPDGRPPQELWLVQGQAYRFVLQTSLAVQIATYDNITGVDNGAVQLRADLADSSDAAKGDALIAVKRTFTGSVATTEHAWHEAQAANVVSDLGADNTGSVDATSILASAFALGGVVIVPPGSYKITSIDATPASSLLIYAYGARFINTAMTSSSAPLLRLRGSASIDVSVYGLSLEGPRLTSSGTVGTGAYTSAGYPSGLDIYTARTATVIDCRSSGTYYCGIEAHFCTRFVVERNIVSNHGYAGILFSDCSSAEVAENAVDDVGSTMVTDGYGITASTSYNTPSYNTPNGVVIVRDNVVTRSKRKGIDVHDGLDTKITGNTVKGFGYAGIYAVCEEISKQVRDVLIQGNRIYGDTSFVASATNFAISVGTFGTSVSQEPSFAIFENETYNLTSAGQIGVNNNETSSQKDTKALSIVGNRAVDCVFTFGIFFNNYTPGRYRSVVIERNNLVNSTTSSAWMQLPYCDSLRIVGNAIAGSVTNASVIYSTPEATTIERNTINGALVGSADVQHYVSGSMVETAFEMAGSLSNVDIIKVDLNANADDSVAALVEAIEVRASNNGVSSFKYNAYGTRVGSGTPSWTPSSATAMSVDTAVFGAVTAPKLIWNVSSGVGTLQFQPQDTFASYIVRVRLVSFRGTVTELAR